MTFSKLCTWHSRIPVLIPSSSASVDVPLPTCCWKPKISCISCIPLRVHRSNYIKIKMGWMWRFPWVLHIRFKTVYFLVLTRPPRPCWQIWMMSAAFDNFPWKTQLQRAFQRPQQIWLKILCQGQCLETPTPASDLAFHFNQSCKDKPKTFCSRLGLMHKSQIMGYIQSVFSVLSNIVYSVLSNVFLITILEGYMSAIVESQN